MQPSLFETATGTDEWFPISKVPTVRHPDHSRVQMRRPFIAWDGEGYTDEFGIHHYWLISNSVGAKLVAPPGRSIHRWNIARLFVETHERYREAIHVGFALGYDFTCILRGSGLADDQFFAIRENQLLKSDGFIYRIMMGKQLTVWPESSENTGSRFNLQDTWGFFQRSFVKALDEYFGKSWAHRDTIVEMKSLRGVFDRDHDEEVKKYNDFELELLVELMEELRDRLFQTGMPISRWYGPGAVANGLMGSWHIKDKIVDLYKSEPQLSKATQYAYAGGRFELFKPGRVGGPTYQYDINSAYPFAIAQLPNLAKGEWVHRVSPAIEDLNEFSLCRISWDSGMGAGKLGLDKAPTDLVDIYPESIPFPFWRRQRNGNISYPSFGVEGWYWTPEVNAGIEYSMKLRPEYRIEYEILESWEFIPENPMYYYTLMHKANWDISGNWVPNWANYDELDDPEKSDILPFWRVPLLYRTRQELKAKGNGAHIGIKLGLNSLYGKFAQQIGYTEQTKKIPTYHNLAYAGWITAKCRAMLLRAMSLNPTAIIATETDGIFSTEKLDLPLGSGLGEWEETRYDDMYYFASGFRFGIVAGQIYKPATRGIPIRDIDLPAILAEIKDSQSILPVTQTQFVTLNWATHMKKLELAGNWRELEKQLVLMCEDPMGKRIHDFDCPNCYTDSEGKRTYDMNALHITLPNSAGAYHLSEPHKIAWVNNTDTEDQKQDAEMDALFTI